MQETLKDTGTLKSSIPKDTIIVKIGGGSEPRRPEFGLWEKKLTNLRHKHV